MNAFGCFKRRRSAFGIDAAIMIAFFTSIMLLLATVGPQILLFFANQLMGGADGAYQLLIELPIIPDNPSTQPASNAPAQWVGWAAAKLYPLLQSMGLALFAVVLVLASLCYLLETFRVMGEGTAMNIITNSVFTLILIFGAKYIYNGVAAAMNMITGWGSVGGTGLIIQSGTEINTLLEALGGSVLSGGVWDVVVRFFGSIVIFIIAVSVLVLAVMMGVVRLLLVGCLAAALPLLLMLRLIPPVKHLADSLIETVIGIVFASLIAAVLIHFGYILVAMTGISGLTKLVVALATLLGTAYMSTMFAGRLGSLFSSVAGMSTMATSMATGLMLGGATTFAGGVTGAVSSLRSGGGRGAILKGFAGGAGTAAAQVLPAILTGKSPGKVLSTAAEAMPIAAQIGKNFAMNHAGTSLESLIYSFAATSYPGESGSEGLEWYQRIDGMSDEAVGHYFADRTGLTLNYAKAGDEIKKTLAGLKGQPVLLDRIHKNLRDFAKQDKDEQHRRIAAAVGAKDANRRRVEAFLGRHFYDPFLEGLDKSPSFVDKILMDVGPTGVQTKARALELMRKDYDESKLSAAAGQEFYDHITKSKTANDWEIGVWVRDNLGIRVPDKTLEHLGLEFKDALDDIVVRNPLLLDNFRRNLEAVKSSGGFKPSGPVPELDRLGENTSWWGKMRERHLTTKRVDLGSDISDFWNLAGSGEGGPPPASPQQTPQQPQPTPPPETPPKGKMEAFMEAQQKKGRRNLLEMQKDYMEYMGESMETGSTNKSE